MRSFAHRLPGRTAGYESMIMVICRLNVLKSSRYMAFLLINNLSAWGKPLADSLLGVVKHIVTGRIHASCKCVCWDEQLSIGALSENVLGRAPTCILQPHSYQARKTMPPSFPPFLVGALSENVLGRTLTYILQPHSRQARKTTPPGFPPFLIVISRKYVYGIGIFSFTRCTFYRTRVILCRFHPSTLVPASEWFEIGWINALNYRK